ncbi:MAG: hypothetical protein AB8B55_16795 [Mariniblastus sp.]
MSTPNRTFGNSIPPDDQTSFVDRRTSAKSSVPGLERRQFSDGHNDLSDDASELGKAIDQYKLINRRRYITYEEMLSIIKSLGYSK